MTADRHTDHDYAAALVTLPLMGPARLLAVLRAWPPDEAWQRVLTRRVMADGDVADACRPDPAGVAALWAQAARTSDPTDVGARHRAAGVAVRVLGRPGYPDVLAEDHQPPAVLFSKGSLQHLEVPRVAIVGTRRCTRYGHDVAHRLGRELAAAGVVVVSGLAKGIDGAAHEGALSVGIAPPVGVVGSGHDVVYPAVHRSLWRRVAEAGALLSEAPLGARPEQWRFPARNRIIAALAQAVVVVESHAAGGSMHTVEAANDRGRPILAVPGPVVSPASAGTNRLIGDGCTPALDTQDVLVALGLDAPAPRRAGATQQQQAPVAPDGPAAAVLDALGWAPATLDQLLGRTGLRPGPAAVALAELEAGGWVAASGGWWERTGISV
ncbi:MAG: processing protein [Actinomycetota bacterium]|jgi:DNA processing protein